MKIFLFSKLFYNVYAHYTFKYGFQGFQVSSIYNLSDHNSTTLKHSMFFSFILLFLFSWTCFLSILSFYFLSVFSFSLFLMLFHFIISFSSFFLQLSYTSSPFSFFVWPLILFPISTNFFPLSPFLIFLHCFSFLSFFSHLSFNL